MMTREDHQDQWVNAGVFHPRIVFFVGLFPTMMNHIWLVVSGTMESYDFPFSWEYKIIPTDFHSIIFQMGRRKTTNQILLYMFAKN